MKKAVREFRVENAVLTPAQWNGSESYDINETENFVGDFVYADSEEEAIVLAMDALAYEMSNNNSDDYNEMVGDIDVDYDSRTMKVFNYDDELIAVYCNFCIR